MIDLDYVIDQLTTSPLDRMRDARADDRLDAQSVEMIDVAEVLGDIAGQLAAPDLSEEWREDPTALLVAVSERLERLALDLNRAAGVVQEIGRDLEEILA